MINNPNKSIKMLVLNCNIAYKKMTINKNRIMENRVSKKGFWYISNSCLLT